MRIPGGINLAGIKHKEVTGSLRHDGVWRCGYRIFNFEISRAAYGLALLIFFPPATEFLHSVVMHDANLIPAVGRWKQNGFWVFQAKAGARW
jgi:hypothetical protein